MTIWRERYETYLASPEWQVKRAQVMHRCKGICENCGEATARTVHHLSYKRLGNEPLVDLLACCQECHDNYHNPKTGPLLDAYRDSFIECLLYDLYLAYQHSDPRQARYYLDWCLKYGYPREFHENFQSRQAVADAELLARPESRIVLAMMAQA